MVVRHEHFVGELNFWDGHWSVLARDANRATSTKIYRIQTNGNVKTIPILKHDGPPTSWSPLLLDAKLKLKNVKATQTVMEAVQGHYVTDGSRTGKSVGDYAKMLAASPSLPMTVGRITLILRDYSTHIPPQWRALMQVPVRNVSDDSYFAQYICVNLSSVEVRPIPCSHSTLLTRNVCQVCSREHFAIETFLVGVSKTAMSVHRRVSMLDDFEGSAARDEEVSRDRAANKDVVF